MYKVPEFEIKNKFAAEFVRSSAQLLQPEKVVVVNGSAAQLELLRREAVATGVFHTLNPDLLPNCYLHRSDPSDVARVEHRTFICTPDHAAAGPTNNHMHPASAKTLLEEISRGASRGRTLYVVPYAMAPLSSPLCKIGIEVTDSVYVAISMCIMTRVSQDALDACPKDFVRGIHTIAALDPEKRYICHFPDENLIWSVNSGYGGNALLGKKCFALRIASVLGRREGWLAEHMLILGVTAPNGQKHYIAAAFPSACGKTNLAMLVPPKKFLDAGYRVETVGDDIAWLRVGTDGCLYAVNPENGFFGVAPGTNEKSNPNAIAASRHDSIFTNVALNTDTNTVWWDGLTSEPPQNLLDWKGNPYAAAEGAPPAAHPNSRITSPLSNCPSISEEYNNGAGVKISALIFGGRRDDTVPLVYEAAGFERGVFCAGTIASQTTAAAAGNVGVLRRDPFAMLPFCGYDMGDYFEHWLQIGSRLKNPPKIFCVNWFNKDGGKFIWPGFGENLRVLLWIIGRCEGKFAAREGIAGLLPRAEDLDTEGLNLSAEAQARLLNFNAALWEKEAAGILEFYASVLKNKVPQKFIEFAGELRQKAAAENKNA